MKCFQFVRLYYLSIVYCNDCLTRRTYYLKTDRSKMNQDKENNNCKEGADYFYYSAFGFSIKSTLELPELLKTDPDFAAQCSAIVSIIECDSSSSQSWGLDADKWMDVKDQNLIFRIKDVGIFRVSDGNSIMFSRDMSLPGNTVLDSDLRVFILGSCFGAIALQNELLPLHASVVTVNDLAVAFVGESGAGKSTMLGSYIAAGYKMLTDDVCVLNFENYYPVVHPSYPQCKYNEDSAAILGHSFENMSWINRFKSKKYLNCSKDMDFEHRRLRKIVLLDTCIDANALHIEEVIGAEKFAIIYRNTYRQIFHKELSEASYLMEQVSQCAQTCRVYRFTRPTNKQYSPLTIVNTVNKYCGLIDGC